MAHLCLSLCSLLQSARQKPVLFCDGRSTTAAELHDQVALLSKTLTERLNTRPGDRIVLLGLNTDAFFTTLLSVLDAGAAACPLNWRWSAAELAAAISLLQPKALFVDDYCMPLALQACASLSAPNSGPPAPIVRMSPSPASDQLSQQQFTRTLSIQTLLLREQQAAAHQGTAPPQFSYSSPACAAPALEPQEQQQPLPPQLQLLHPSPRQPALVVFTSGTTGASKGVMLSHTNLTHQSLAKLAVVQYSAADTYLHMAPLFHIGGLSSAFAVLMAGGAHVLMPRYSPKTALQLIQQHIVTSLIAVPAMMQDLTAAAAAAAVSASDGQQHQQQQKQQQHQQQQKQQPQLPSLQRVLVGAGGMPLRLQRAVAALFPHAILQTAYGMTEASSSVTFVSVQEQQQLMAAATTAATAAAAAAADGAEGYGSSGRSVYAVGVCVGRPGPGIAVRIDLSALPSSSSSSSSSQHHQQHHRLQQQQLQQQGEEGAGPAAAKAGVVGEVCTRGPHVMLGYWRDAQATSKALSASGWLHTGLCLWATNEGGLRCALWGLCETREFKWVLRVSACFSATCVAMLAGGMFLFMSHE